MEFVYLKIVLLLNAWLLAKGSPVAMLHATSSQSIVFHQAQATSARPITSQAPANQYGGSPPKYEYKYEVSDHETGDRKSHWESRDGDKVRGVYTLYEPDGALRTVEYTADDLHGFNAVVSRNEASKHSPSSGRKHLSSSTAHSGYEQHPNNYMPDLSIYSASHDMKTSGKPSYNQGVDFSVVHGTRKIEDMNQIKFQ